MSHQPTYLKIVETHTILRKSPLDSVSKFYDFIVQKVLKGGRSSFTYYDKDEQDQTIQRPCKLRTVDRNLGFFRSLKLLKREPDFGLTDEAAAITDGPKLDQMIEKYLLEYMNARGFPLDEIKEKMKSGALATGENLYRLMSTSTVSKIHFKQCLSLLNRVSDKISTHNGIIYKDPDQPNLPGM